MTYTVDWREVNSGEKQSKKGKDKSSHSESDSEKSQLPPVSLGFFFFLILERTICKSLSWKQKVKSVLKLSFSSKTDDTRGDVVCWCDLQCSSQSEAHHCFCEMRGEEESALSLSLTQFHPFPTDNLGAVNDWMFWLAEHGERNVVGLEIKIGSVSFLD